MFQCQVLFGESRGAEICALLEDATESLCPCKTGSPCPLAGVVFASAPDGDPALAV